VSWQQPVQTEWGLGSAEPSWSCQLVFGLALAEADSASPDGEAVAGLRAERPPRPAAPRPTSEEWLAGEVAESGWMEPAPGRKSPPEDVPELPS